MEDKRAQIETLLDYVSEHYLNATPGSEEAERLSRDLERYYKLYLEDIRVQEYLFNDQAEVRRKDGELILKQVEQAAERKASRRLKPDTILNNVTLWLLAFFSVLLQVNGEIEPKMLQTLFGKLKLN